MELFGLRKKKGKKKGLLCEVNCIIKMFLNKLQGHRGLWAGIHPSSCIPPEYHRYYLCQNPEELLPHLAHKLKYSNRVKDSQFPTKSSSNGTHSLMMRNISCNQMRHMTFIWMLEFHSDHCTTPVSRVQHGGQSESFWDCKFGWWDQSGTLYTGVSNRGVYCKEAFGRIPLGPTLNLLQWEQLWVMSDQLPWVT